MGQLVGLLDHPAIARGVDDHVGAILADPKGRLSNDKITLDDSAVKKLEELIDRFDSRLAPLTTFILPGGSTGGA